MDSTRGAPQAQGLQAIWGMDSASRAPQAQGLQTKAHAACPTGAAAGQL